MSKVKLRRRYESIFEGEEEVGKYLVEEMHYSVLGELLHQKEHSEEGQIVAELKQTFENGNLIGVHNINSFEGIDQKTEYSYEEDRLVMMIDHYKAGDFIKTTYSYNDDGKLLEVLKIDNDGESHGKVLYEYDDVERVIRETHYNAFDEESYELEITEDENGNQTEIIERYFKGPDNYTEKIEAHIFDKNGALISAQISFEEELVLTVKNERNENGQLISQVKKEMESELVSETSFVLDEKGRRIKEEELHDAEIYRTREIKYNEHDEVIEEKSYTKVNEDFFKAERNNFEIEYFEA